MASVADNERDKEGDKDKEERVSDDTRASVRLMTPVSCSLPTVYGVNMIRHKCWSAPHSWFGPWSGRKWQKSVSHFLVMGAHSVASHRVSPPSRFNPIVLPQNNDSLQSNCHSRSNLCPPHTQACVDSAFHKHIFSPVQSQVIESWKVFQDHEERIPSHLPSGRRPYLCNSFFLSLLSHDCTSCSSNGLRKDTFPESKAQAFTLPTTSRIRMNASVRDHTITTIVVGVVVDPVKGAF